jgi:hypothetical protein
MTEIRDLGPLLMEWELPIQHSIDARILPVDETRVLVANRETGCLLFDVERQTCVAQPWKTPDWARLHAISPYPTSLTVSRAREHPRKVAAAGGGAFFVHWDLETGNEKIVETGSNVQSVSLSHDGSMIACGLGHYPLGPSNAQAVVELWNPSSGTCVKRRRLLGVATSAVQWMDGNNDRIHHPDANLANGAVIVATTCMSSQDRGHLWILDAANLAILDVLDLDHGPMSDGLKVWPEEGWIQASRKANKAIDAFDVHGGEPVDTDDLGATLCCGATLFQTDLPSGRVVVLSRSNSGTVVLNLHECLE